MVGNYRIMKIKSLTIYCSSSEKLDQNFYDLAEKIGDFLGKNQKIVLINIYGRLLIYFLI